MIRCEVKQLKGEHMKPGRSLDLLIAEKVMGTTSSNPCIEIKDLPHYSSDIAASWEVVEKMKEEFDYAIYCRRKEDNCVYYFADFEGKGKHNLTEGCSAPHAICVAALRAKGVEV